MTYLAKPKFHHPDLPKNDLGYTHRDYEGAVSTLCAGCGHDSISAADHRSLLRTIDPAAPGGKTLRHRLLVEDADLFPRQFARLQFRARPHAVGADRRQSRQPRSHLSRRLRRRRLAPRSASASSPTPSAAASTWSISSRTTASTASPRASSRPRPTTARSPSAASSTPTAPSISSRSRSARRDLRRALRSPATRQQLVPIIKAAIEHEGAAFIDVISPCVAFNNHAGSTKSFDYVREHNEAVDRLDFITGRAPIKVDYAPGNVEMVEQHDGTTLACASSTPTTTSTTAPPPWVFCSITPPRGRSSPGCSTSRQRPRTCTGI